MAFNKAILGKSIWVAAASGDTSGVKDTATINTAISHINSSNGGVINIPAGVYYVKGSLLTTITQPVSILGNGAGAHDAVLKSGGNVEFNYSTSQVINVENNSPVFTIAQGASCVKDIRITYSGVSAPVNGSTAIKQNISTGGWCRYVDSVFDGHYVGLDIWRGQANQIHGNIISGNYYCGIRLNNMQTMDYGDNRIINNLFLGSQWGNIGLAALYWQSGSGLVFDQNKVNTLSGGGLGGAYAYSIVINTVVPNQSIMPDGSTYQTDLSGQNFGLGVAFIRGNSLENTVLGAILMFTSGPEPLGDYVISDNEFLMTCDPSTAYGAIVPFGSFGTGYKIGDVLTVSTFSGTGATLVVDGVGPNGEVFGYHQITTGAMTANAHGRDFNGYGASATGGSGTGAQFGTLPPYNITVFNTSNNVGTLMIHDNRSYAQFPGIYLLGATSGGVIGKNSWNITNSTHTALNLAAYGGNITCGQVDVLPQQTYYSSTHAPVGWLFNEINPSIPDSNQAAITTTGNKLHDYIFPIVAVGVNTQVNCFTITLSQYVAAIVEFEFEGSIYISGAWSSVCAKFKRIMSIEASGATVILNIVDTDIGIIAGTMNGANNTPTNTSNVWSIGAATGSFAVGIIPGAGKLQLYVKATGTNVTNFGGKMTLKVKGPVTGVGYGAL